MEKETTTSLIHIQSSSLVRVATSFKITDKILGTEFDCIRWWEELNEKWKYNLRRWHRGKVGSASIKELKQVELSEQEKIAAKLYSQIDSEVMSKEAIKYILSWKIMPGGVTINVPDLEPVSAFNDLHELHLFDGTSWSKSYSLYPLRSLKKLKLLRLAGMPLPPDELENFRMLHPNCKIEL